MKPKSPKHHTCRVEAKDKVLMGDSRCLHITVDSNIKVSNLKWEEKDLQKIKNRCTPILNLYVCYEKNQTTTKFARKHTLSLAP